jgi:outer membrane protein assembly factor BamD
MKIPSPFAIAVLALAIAACSSNPDKKDEPGDRSDRETVFKDRDNDPLKQRREERRLAQLDAAQLYKRARQTLESSDYSTAIENYDLLSTRYPFSDYATQGELERIYALYRSFDPERALSSADRFLREHPRHPAIDYVHYVKGLVNFSRDESNLSILPIDESKSDVTSQRRAFDDFALLIQKFPGSKYAGDAYARMVFIRNRLAAHELHVVDFYVRRGAYVAAAKRAEQVIAQYPGTPATYRALEHLVKCYELAGLEQQAQDARKLLAAQDPKVVSALNVLAPADLQVAAVDATPPAPQPPAKRGVMSRIAGFFSPLDTSDGGVEVVIPSAKSEPAPAAAANPSTAASAPGAAQAEPVPTRSNKLEVFYEPYDAPAPTPPAAPAKPEAAAP